MGELVFVKTTKAYDIYKFWIETITDKGFETAERFLTKDICDSEKTLTKKDVKKELSSRVLETIKDVTYNTFPQLVLQKYGVGNKLGQLSSAFKSTVNIEDGKITIHANEENANRLIPDVVIKKLKEQNPSATMRTVANILVKEIMDNALNLDEIITKANEIISKKATKSEDNAYNNGMQV